MLNEYLREDEIFNGNKWAKHLKCYDNSGSHKERGPVVRDGPQNSCQAHICVWSQPRLLFIYLFI